ncbi:MAG: chorismate mutase [Bryobacterales bacterium]|nr:chorismate mutase [Bryobacterales bacterium]
MDQARELLAIHRARIDEIDRQIRDLLNQRTTVVEQIGRIKREAALPIYEPRREDQVFRNVMESNSGPLPSDALKRVFERIIDEMRTVQRDRMKD